MIRRLAAVLSIALLVVAAEPTHAQAGQWQYHVTVTHAGQVQDLGTRVVVVSAASYGQGPSWLVVASGGRDPLTSLDSLYVDTLALRPQHWSSTLGESRVAAAFALDTIFGATISPMGRQNIVLANPGRLVVSPEQLALVLGKASLTAAWRDSITMLVTDPVATATAPATMVVNGDEKIAGPAGTFDCWIVDVSAGRGEDRLWVAKSGGVVVRSVQRVPQVASDGMLTRELMSAAPTH